MPTVIIELVLQIVLEAIKGQPPEVKAKMWEMYITDIIKWREFWDKLGSKITLPIIPTKLP